MVRASKLLRQYVAYLASLSSEPRHQRARQAYALTSNLRTASTASEASTSTSSHSPAVPSGPRLPYAPSLYKQLVRQSYDSLSRLPDVSVDPLSEELARRTMAFAQLRPGQRVLDIASGPGALLLLAARAVSPGGSVLGLDISPGMVEQARSNLRLATPPVRGADLVVGDAEAAELPAASFDALLASAALPYMADPAAAAARWRRWLRPGGRLVLNCYKSPYDPECGLFYRLAAEHGLGHLIASPLEPVGSAERCRELLERAGYERVQVTEETIDVGAPAASARAHAEAMWESSASAPHHNLAVLTAGPAAAAASTATAAAAAGGVAAAERGGMTSAGSAGGARGSGAIPAPRGVRGSQQSPPRAAQQQHRLGRGTSQQAPAPLGGGPRKPQQQGQQQQGPQGQGQAAGQGPAARVDPAAVAAFREAFLAAAEGSAKERLKRGAVRNTVGVLYAVAHAP